MNCCNGVPVNIAIEVENNTIVEKTVRNSINIYDGMTTILDVDLVELLAVGGTIFYDAGDNGETYKFYDENMEEITGIPIGNTEVKYYSISGTPSKDRYYVFNPNLDSDRCYWGYDDITTGATDDYIGSGKINTAKVMAITDTSYSNKAHGMSEPSIWEYIANVNSGEGTNGCNDWFIGSMAEYDKLKETGLSSGIRLYETWTSVESEDSKAYFCGQKLLLQ